ncbi:glycosyltransferase [Mycobacterium mantenii]|uniref:Glycosyl transferase n=1 Tax=Mycobacterium mantenii TaxID=560555 RepID=A0A1A2SY09_MYCNT|nr:glycosyltransferase [Mycobacterium mantenii]OBH42564.1 glycosyl transferase [Mycobacterium mantenii]OBH53712.1 glycosyl transferase [Mycobacterium mantenii]OBH67194.1 glycosyl transferase [Mycobacterium mantenii]OBH69030.1 glycosyl transferase [Mycobacterium mantenii]
MRVLLSAYDSRGGVEPLAALAVQLRTLGVDARVSAPPDAEFVELLAGVGVRMLPLGDSLRAMKTGATPSEEDLRRHLDGLIAAQFDTVAAAAQGCDAVVVAGFPPAAAAARSASESLGIPYVYVSYQPTILPSPHHPPPGYANGPFPAGAVDNRVLWQLDGRHMQELFGETLNGHRASLGLPPLDNLRDYALTDRPWLATDPILDPWRPGDLDVVQTGAWLLRDERPLPAELVTFLESGAPPVYVGFGSMPMRASADVARTAIEAVRAQGRRVLVSCGWAGLAPIDDRDDCFAVGDVNHQALFGRVAAAVHHGGAGTTTAAARAGAPQVVVPQGADQPYWAARVRDLGIGAAHDGPAPSTESLSAVLKTALTEPTRARASAVAATIRADGATVAAKLLVNALAR